MSDKATRAELIAALVTDKYSGFKPEDQAMLETASDTRLDEFRAAADASRNTATTIVRMENDQRTTTARLKVAEDRIVKLESPMTDEEFTQRAPASIKSVLEARQAEEASLKASLVSSLKNLGGETEDELKKKTIPELQTLARYAGVKVLDFSGRGVQVERNAQQSLREDYKAPDPWSASLEKMRAAEARQ